MNNHSVLKLKSSTNAMKASSVLLKNGIECSISRTVTTADGCIYTLTVYKDFEKAQSILQKYGIDYIMTEEGAAR